MMDRLYPESKVEIQGFTAKHYDTIMNIVSFGFYAKFIGDAIPVGHFGYWILTNLH
jgi:hypothetical protein